MKREILFKAKRVDNGEWVESTSIVQCNHFGVKKVGIIYRFFYEERAGFNMPTFLEVYPDTVCQFTGLLDKNGVEIFEGDKIKYWGGVGIIVYKDATYYLMTKYEFGQEDLIHITQCADIHGEVIGNIHDKIEKP